MLGLLGLSMDDPHSPKKWGLKTMLLQGIQVYRAAKTRETVDLYSQGPQELLNALKQWISEAEKSGNLMLEKFSSTMSHDTTK